VKKLNENFIKWACSLSGCDGGSPDATIWASGIEWGFKGDPSNYYSQELPAEIQKGAYEPKSKQYPWEDSFTYTYGQSLAKLYYAIKGSNIRDYKKIAEEKDKHELFKTNLYPIAFNSVDPELWKKYKLNELTGFAEKHLFRTWCFLHRFPAISKMVSEKSPKLIIGTGVSYLTDFFACYAGSSNIDTTINVGELIKTKKRKYYWAKLSNGTMLVIIPFFSSQSGLNSGDLLQEMGEKIRELVPDL
jgi:hypothetical protein